MKSRSNFRKAALHLGVWMAAFFINIILIQGYSVKINWSNTLVSWLLYVFIFYINYLLLIPKLFRRRWFVFYALTALAILAVSFVSIKYTAVETARRSTGALNEQMQQYADVREAFDEKERQRERQRDIERIREREGKESQETKVSPRPGRGSGTRPVMERRMLHFPGDSLLSDSLFRAQIRREQDSVLALNIAFTAREEEYGQLRREYERTRAYARWLSRSDYNPFSQHNLQFIFALIFFYMASIVAYFAEQTVRAEKRRREMEKEKANAELAYLKQQINPHFLFNTLNSIYSYTIGVSEEASDAVLKLSSILRYMLYETNRARVPLADELAVLDSYIALQRLRTTEKTEIDVIVDGDTRLRQIEPMLLVPIVENAFKYGVDSVEQSFVRVEVGVKGGDFTFRTTNRIVRRNEGDAHHSGIGLNNIRRRLELIYGAGNYEMNVTEKKGVFSVSLHLSLKD